MSLQTIAIIVDAPEDQQTAVESAAAAAVESLQSAGVVVTAASFGGVSLLPSPADLLRSAVDALAELSSAGTPTKAALQAAVAKVDDAARVVESIVSDAAPAPAAPAAPSGFALPDETPAGPVVVADATTA